MVLTFRLKVFSAHLGLSVLLLSAVFLFLYLGWYAWPAWYLMGAATITGLMVLVDVGLGPLATLVVSNPAKPRSELKRDIALIAVIQLAALLYGVHTLWAMRPVYYVFSTDRIELVSAASIADEDVALAREAGVRDLPGAFSLPRWVWAPLPDDQEKAQEIVANAISTGKDVTSMPQYYRPIEAGHEAMRARFQGLDRLAKGVPGFSVQAYQEALSATGRSAEELAYLPIQARERDGGIIFDRKTMQPLAFWPVFVVPAGAS